MMDDVNNSYVSQNQFYSGNNIFSEPDEREARSEIKWPSRANNRINVEYVDAAQPTGPLKSVDQSLISYKSSASKPSRVQRSQSPPE